MLCSVHLAGVDMPLAVMLVYLAMTSSDCSFKLAPDFSYTNGRLASVGVPRLAVLNPPFHDILTFVTTLGDRSLLTISFVKVLVLGSPQQLFTNYTARAFLAKVTLFRISANSSRCYWLSIFTVVIYPIHIAQSTYTHIYDSHLKILGSWIYRAGSRILFQFLQLLALHFLAWLTTTRVTTTKATDRKPLRFLQFYVFSGFQSIFNFLRFQGPRRLRASRRILVDGDEYQIMQVGRGAFATISRVLHRPSSEIRVMKRIVFDKSGLAKELAQAEIDSLRAMAGSPWFPSLLNHFADDEEFIITMPFYARGDMAGLIQHKGYLGSELARFYCAQLILAIQSLHKRGIIHRDIKPDNIFLDETGHLILADLGLAENIGTFSGTDSEMNHFPIWKEAKAREGEDFPLLWVDGLNPLGTKGIAGTYWYTAPEVFRNERYSFGVDYYSVGVIYYELVTGNLPFDFKPYPEDKIPVVDFRRSRGQLKILAPWEEQAVHEIIAPNPSDRPRTVTQLKANALFVGVDWKKMSSREIPPPPLPLPLREG